MCGDLDISVYPGGAEAHLTDWNWDLGNYPMITPSWNLEDTYEML